MRSAPWPERRGWRAYLFVPPNLIGKAADPALRRLGPLILDLEDAVPPSRKEEARRVVATYLLSGPPAYVRINGYGTQWFDRDLAALGSDHLLGVLVPKAETVEAIRLVREAVPPNASAIPLIETALGLRHVDDLAGCVGVERLAFGALDFRLDLHLGHGPLELLYARSRIVVASRAADILSPLDSVETELRSESRLSARAKRARQCGFGGKLCVHPLQAAIIGREFLPQPSTVNWAKEVLSADQEEPREVDGQMVDAPVRAEARAILEEAELRSTPDP